MPTCIDWGNSAALCNCPTQAGHEKGDSWAHQLPATALGHTRCLTPTERSTSSQVANTPTSASFPVEQEYPSTGLFAVGAEVRGVTADSPLLNTTVARHHLSICSTSNSEGRDRRCFGTFSPPRFISDCTLCSGHNTTQAQATEAESRQRGDEQRPSRKTS